MKTYVWLTISGSGAVEARKNPPGSLPSGKVALCLNLELPDALFRPRPSILATVKVGPEGVLPATITVDEVTVIQEAIQRSTELDVHLSIESPGEPA